MREAPVPNGFITVLGAADRLGVSRTKVWRLIDEGVLSTQPDVLDKRRRLIRIEDVDRLVKGRDGEQLPNARAPN